MKKILNIDIRVLTHILDLQIEKFKLKSDDDSVNKWVSGETLYFDIPGDVSNLKLIFLSPSNLL